MAHTVAINLALGSSQTGLALEALIVDTGGAPVGSAVATGFTEIGVGNYLHSLSVPDGQRGGVIYRLSSDHTTVKAFVGLNPEEVENADTKTSTRSSHTAADVWAVGTRTLSSFGTLVADVATAVWAAAARTLTAFGFQPTVGGYASGQDPTTLVLGHSDASYTTPGTIGYDIRQGLTATDPLLNPVPGSYPAGSAGAVLGAITTGDITTVSPGTSHGTLELVIGQTYSAAHSSAIVDTLTSTDPDLAGAVVTLEVGAHNAVPFLTAAVAVSGLWPAQQLTTTLSSAATGALSENRDAHFAYWADWEGPPAARRCLKSGPCRIVAAP